MRAFHLAVHITYNAPELWLHRRLQVYPECGVTIDQSNQHVTWFLPDDCSLNNYKIFGLLVIYSRDLLDRYILYDEVYGIVKIRYLI